MMYEATSFECSRIAQDLQIRKVQVESVVQLFNEGNTVPFITRYRKERTGGLDEESIRQIQTRLNFLKQLNERKQTILRSIENQRKLTDELRREILNAPTVRRLEDLYLPFKPKKKGLALAAREKGLEPLALVIWHSDPAVGNLDELLPALVNPEKGLNTVEEVKTGVQQILAEMVNETAEVRAQVRRVLWKTAAVASAKSDKAQEGQGNEFKPYFQFKEAAQDIRPHRILALNRGEKEGILKVKLEWPTEPIRQTALAALADYLLQMAGKPVPAPSQPAQPTKPSTPGPGQVPAPSGPPMPVPAPAPAPTAPPETPGATSPEAPPTQPGPETPPLRTPPEATQIQPAEAPSREAPPEIPLPPALVETPPSGTPSVETPPPHAAPLVESLATEVPPTLAGEPLADGINFRSPHTAFLTQCLDDAVQRLLLPSLEREIRSELTDEAELHAIKVFAHNIRSLLMQPPLIGRRVLAIDPGFRTGCRLAALDESGNLLDQAVIYPHGGGPGSGKKKEHKKAQEPAGPAAPIPASDQSAPTPEPASQPAPTVEAPTTAPELAETTTPTPEMGPVIDASAPSPTSESTNAANTPANQTADSLRSPDVPAVDKRAEAKAKLVELVQQHHLDVIALGNGTACRETEEVIAEVIASGLPELSYVIVSEAGASAYSVSPIAKEEFPNLDSAIRSGASIARRLQDPLRELVKIDLQSLGVGLYQHDMGRKELKETLEGVVESCVNQVGVDVNNASAPLLRYVSGLNQLVAREIVEHRRNQGPFTAREQLMGVSGMNPTRYVQAAGFLKIPNATNPLDRTWIHPESYPLAEKIFAEFGCTSSVLNEKGTHEELRARLNSVSLEELAKKLEVSVPTLDDLFHALAKPGRDVREDLPPPIFKKGVLKLEDLQAGMELKGTVLNVVDFGAFVDVGLKDSGLVHISQMANKYIKSPYDVVSVNDIVTVWVLKIDKDSNHVSLTMIQPGSERKSQERRSTPPRREGDGQTRERGQRPPPRSRGPGAPAREGQREGSGQRQGQDSGRPPRGRSAPLRQEHGGPLREQQRQAAPPPPAPPPPRKPRREAPKPKLTQAAMEGKAPLRTLSELAAFFAAKEEKDKAPATPAAGDKKEIAPVEAPPAPDQKGLENAGSESPPG
jgi:transcriptional accessory protein Tex/SPT6